MPTGWSGTQRYGDRRREPERERSARRTTAHGHRSDLSRGTRPPPLSVGVEPQDRLEAAARVSSGVPSVAPPALAAPADEGVDTSTLRFFAAAALYSRKLEEEDKKKREEEEEELKRLRNIPLNQLTQVQQQKIVCWMDKEKEKEKAKEAVGVLRSTSSSSSGFSRKRKKKRRKRTRRRR